MRRIERGVKPPFSTPSEATTNMPLQANQDFFELFGLQPRFALDAGVLERSYREIQSQIHPDKFAHASEADRRASMQWTARINEAYQTLKHPLTRAAYLLELRGIDPALESNTAMAPEFLSEQMGWREAVAEALQAGDCRELERLSLRLRGEIDRLYGEIGTQLDDHRVEAAETLRKLKFMEKVAEEIASALERLEV